MEVTDQDFDELVRRGWIGRWWCERCEDWVPYKKIVLDPAQDVLETEEGSRLGHAEAWHKRD